LNLSTAEAGRTFEPASEKLQGSLFIHLIEWILPIFMTFYTDIYKVHLCASVSIKKENVGKLEKSVLLSVISDIDS
jgi:hypothetical protein